jgi:glycosyltransferase involved in cell wall biosynthesis
MSTPVVSVVISTWQRPVLLRDTLESIRAQTLRDIEVLVVSDGPSAEDEAVVQALNDPRFVALSCPHQGRPAPARNVGLSRARGELIAFCDDDDLWDPGKLGAQLTTMQRHPSAAVCFTGLLNMGGDGVVRGRRRSPPRCYDRWPRLGYLTLPAYYIAPSSVMAPRTIVSAVGGFDEEPLLRGREDTEWLVRVAFRTRRRFVRVPEPLVRYRLDEARPGIGLQAGKSHTMAFLAAVQRNSQMSERCFHRFAALHLVLFARVQIRAGAARSDVMATLREADRFGFSLLGWSTRMRLMAGRAS